MRAVYVALTSFMAGAVYAGLAALINEVAEKVIIGESVENELAFFLIMLFFFLFTKWLSLSLGVVLI